MKIKTKETKGTEKNLKALAQQTRNKMKRQPSEWEKIIASEATGKQLLSKIYKQFIYLNIRKQTI